MEYMSFFLEIARGQEGLSSNMIMMLQYSLFFFRESLTFTDFAVAKFRMHLTYPNLHMCSFEQRSALGNLSQLYVDMYML